MVSSSSKSIFNNWINPSQKVGWKGKMKASPRTSLHFIFRHTQKASSSSAPSCGGGTCGSACGGARSSGGRAGDLKNYHNTPLVGPTSMIRGVEQTTYWKEEA